MRSLPRSPTNTSAAPFLRPCANFCAQPSTKFTVMLHKKENQFSGLFIVKRKHPVRMLPLWYARADSNRWPTESESVLKHSFFLGVSMVSCFAGATQVQHHATTYSVRCNITAQNSLTHSAELNKKKHPIRFIAVEVVNS